MSYETPQPPLRHPLLIPSLVCRKYAFNRVAKRCGAAICPATVPARSAHAFLAHPIGVERVTLA